MLNHNDFSFDSSLLLNKKIPALVIRDFYSKSECKKLVSKINNNSKLSFHNTNYIGPFLMNYTTQKNRYFEDSKNAIKTFDKIFSNSENPIDKIHDFLNLLFPRYSISNANEEEKNYSPCIIRIHPRGSRIPLHKDRVDYEGTRYRIAKIDSQLSCVLHLQESESGGELKIYHKSWFKVHEKHREIEFGYDSRLVDETKFCLIRPKTGDLVILNPTYFHEVLPVSGESPRISLGMFAGVENARHKILTWA